MKKAYLIFFGMLLVFFSVYSGCKDNSDEKLRKQYSDLQVAEDKGDMKAAEKDSDLKTEERNSIKTSEVVELYYFYGTGCPNCEKVKQVIRNLSTRKGLVVKKYEVWYNKKNRSMLLQMAKERSLNIKGVPAIIIANDLYMGVKEITGLQDKIGRYYK